MHSRTAQRLGALTIALTMAVATAASAAEASPRQRYVEARQAGGVASPDDFGGSTRPAADATTASAYLGAAPWICSPSGFGQRSKCFRRASLRARGR